MAPVSASALTPICTLPFQSRPDELTHSLAPSSGAGETPRKTLGSGVKAPLLFDVRLGAVACRTEVTGNDLVQQPGDTSIGAGADSSRLALVEGETLHV